MKNTIILLLAILLPIITLAQPTGVWEATFGASPDETIQAIKAKTSLSPANVETYGKVSAVTYENCVVDNQNYRYIQLQFFDKQLCGGTLECEAGDNNYQKLIDKYQQRYGLPNSSTPKFTGWSFGKQYTILISNNFDKRTVTTQYYLQPAYQLYAEELKNLPDDTPNTATPESVNSKVTTTEPAPLKELTGFWGIQLGQSPETVINTLKTTKKYSPSKRKPEGKKTDLYYNNCTFGGDKCTEAHLVFYNSKLCGAIFSIPCTTDHLAQIIKAMEEKYGPAKKPGANIGIWDFKDNNSLYIHMAEDETAQVLYSRDKEVEQMAKERKKTEAADY